MPTPKLVQIEAWSASRLNDYEKCPQLAFYKHVQKLKEPGSAVMDRGGDIHKMGADFASGKTLLDLTRPRACIPKELERFKQEFLALRRVKPKVEQQAAFTREWKPTGWFDTNAWVRVILDAQYYDPKVRTAHVIDYKTGKIYEDHKDVAKLYALAAFILYPEAVAVRTNYWYLDLGVEHPTDFARADVPALKKYWEKRTKPMLADTRFNPNPGRHCSWCFFSHTKDGPCKAG